MNLLNKIKAKLHKAKLHNCIKRAKYVHIMFNDKFNKPFVDFLNSNFNPKEHIILCKKWFDEHPFPVGKNVIEINSIKEFNFDKNKKIICHSLFDSELVEYLYEHKNILKNKAYWLIWGGDLYGASRDEKNDYVRKNFKGYISCIKGDENIAKEKYNSSPELYTAPYSAPVDINVLKKANCTKDKNIVRIQINNSSDKSTLEMLDILSKFKDENIKITTILSYGDLNYKDEIIKKGKEIYNDKFEYLEHYMNPQDYANHLAGQNILIFNQDRQQGVGNCFAGVYLGLKLYVKSTVTSYKYLQNLGFTIYDTLKIPDMDFTEFSSIPDDIIKQNNTEVKKIYDTDYMLSAWKKIF